MLRVTGKSFFVPIVSHMYFLSYQGIYTLQPYIRSRIIRVSVEDIKVLLTQENPYLSKLEDEAHAQAQKIGTVKYRYALQLCVFGENISRLVFKLS